MPKRIAPYHRPKAPQPPRARLRGGRLHEVLRGKRAVSPETALRLGRYFGNEAEFWLNLQTQYDLAEVRKRAGARIASEVEAAA